MKCANQRSGYRTLILVDDGKDNSLASIAGLRCGGDNNNYEDRHQQQPEQSHAVAANEPQVLKNNRQQLHVCGDPLGRPYLRRISTSKSSGVIRARRSFNWLARLSVSLTPSTLIAVARQLSPFC